MKINDVIRGFILKDVREVEEIKATSYMFEHEKTGAKLLWLDREDDNKTFSIAFKTTPVDDTGVFHILEHSVLNGSKRYPVKEPFVDLLKGSLQTFLNAMTFPDKTVYPISSRNNQDFFNLMRVYLDAVFYPLCVESDYVFNQEGWHYELTDKGNDPLIKGVVYNEMKGAFSSSESVAAQALMTRLFPDTTYGYCSGGDPDHIPELTYQQFVASHKKYYNASNARIFLDGKVDLDATLAIIDEEYLSNMTRSDETIVIEKQEPVDSGIFVKEVEATTTENKAIINFGYVIDSFDNYVDSNALKMLMTLLLDDNQSPLKKAILEKGLAEDVYCAVEDGIYQPYVEIMVVNTKEENYEEIEKTIRETLESEIAKGFDKDEISAIINKAEFAAKEREFGGMPKGIVFAIGTLSTWLYDGDPIDGITVNSIYGQLKERLSTSYYEDLIRKVILDSNHKATVIIRPSTTLEAENQQKMAQKMADYKKSLTTEQLNELLEFNQRFSKWQQLVDTPEQKETLPHLTLDDIDKKPIKIEKSVEVVEGINVIRFLQETEGINYYKLIFDIKDASLEQLQYLNLLCSLLGSVETKQHSLNQLNQLVRRYLGEISFDTTFVQKLNSEDYHSLLTVSYSCLKEYKTQAWDLVKEIMYESKLTDKKAIDDLLKQYKNEAEMSIYTKGHMYGMSRATAHISEANTCTEYVSGYQYYTFLKGLAENSDGLEEKLTALYANLFTTNRLTISAMTSDDLTPIINDIKKVDGEVVKCEREKMSKMHEGIEVASKVAYGEMAVKANRDISDVRGKLEVITKLLSLDYLWTNVRAIGGAYGCGFIRRGQSLGYYSYRDPNPNNSLHVYTNTKEYLKAFIASDQDLLTYIIGAIGDNDPLLTNKTTLTFGTTEYFSGVSYEDRCNTRMQILEMDKKQIEELLPLFDFSLDDAGVCVIASKDALEACGYKIEVIREV